jgi:uncharacterized tellurite resistance protein B-like protein
MFNFFKKNLNTSNDSVVKQIFDIELIGFALAYEVARSDGEIDQNELSIIKKNIADKSNELDYSAEEVLKKIEEQSNNQISFHNFINDINNFFSIDEKYSLLKFLWETAYSDNVLTVDEERLIRRIADMLHIKDLKVLKFKHEAKNNTDN